METGNSNLIPLIAHRRLDQLKPSARELLTHFYYSGKQAPNSLTVVESSLALVAWSSDGNDVWQLVKDICTAANKFSGYGRSDLQRYISLIGNHAKCCPTITIIVDALGASEDPWELVSSLKKMSLRFLWESKSFDDKQDASRSSLNISRLHGISESNTKDIRFYVEREVANSFRSFLNGAHANLEGGLIDVLSGESVLGMGAARANTYGVNYTNFIKKKRRLNN